LRVELGDITVGESISEDLYKVFSVCHLITSGLTSLTQTGKQAIYAKSFPSSQWLFFSTVFRGYSQTKSL